MSDTMHIKNMFARQSAILYSNQTLVKYTSSSGLPTWIGTLPNPISGSGMQDSPTYSIPNIYQSESIYLGNNVTNVSTYAFQHCSSIKSIVFSKNIAIIGVYTFRGCNSCKIFDFSRATSVPTLGGYSSFNNTPSDKEIIVPDALYDDWIVADNWSSTTNNIVNCIIKASQSSLGTLTT